jgi:hypothetical protein
LICEKCPDLQNSHDLYIELRANFETATRPPVTIAKPEWAGTKGYYAPEAMVDAWIREKRFFRPGVFPDNSTTGNVEDIGHYTRLIWRATTEVGCAEAASEMKTFLPAATPKPATISANGPSGPALYRPLGAVLV